MLDIAKEKGIYQSLQKVDLLQELPLEQDTFDLAVSSAVSTYLGEYYLLRSRSTCESISKRLHVPMKHDEGLEYLAWSKVS